MTVRWSGQAKEKEERERGEKKTANHDVKTSVSIVHLSPVSRLLGFKLNAQHSTARYIKF